MQRAQRQCREISSCDHCGCTERQAYLCLAAAAAAAEAVAGVRFDWINTPSKTPRRRGVVVSGVRRHEVNARRARLVPGRVTVFGPVCHLGM